MKVWSKLSPNRLAEGTLWVTNDEDALLLGPVRARGEADNSGAAAHGNPIEDPTKAYGDHPGGLYRILLVLRHPSPEHSYGPAFLKLDPVSGEALTAKQNGRSGFGIHGGDFHQDGRLRETYGCLRVENETAAQLADLLDLLLQQGEIIFYECLIEGAAV